MLELPPSQPDINAPGGKHASFVRLEAPTQQLDTLIHDATEAAHLPPDYARTTGVYLDKTLPLSKNLPFSSLLDLLAGAHDEFGIPRRVAIYSPGISGGIPATASTEYFSSASGLTGLSLASAREMPQKALSKFTRNLSPEKAEADEGAIDFLRDGGFAMAIMLEPSRGHASSLSADAVALYKTIEECKAHGITPDIVCWSNGGFKLTEDIFGAFSAIDKDRLWAREHGIPTKGISPEHWLTDVRRVRERESSLYQAPAGSRDKKHPLWRPVFVHGEEAWKFLRMIADTRIIMAGSPLNAAELSIPVDANASSAMTDILKRIGRTLVNTSIIAAGKHEDTDLVKSIANANFLPHDIKTLLSRILEMGRGPTMNEVGSMQVDDIDGFTEVKKIVRQGLGSAQIGVLMEFSGSVVNVSEGGVAQLLTAIIGKDHVTALQSRNVPLFKHDAQGTPQYYRLPDKHEMLKIRGILNATFAWLAATQVGLVISNDTAGLQTGSRIMPVNPNQQVGRERGMPKWKNEGFDWQRFSSLAQGSIAMTPKEQAAFTIVAQAVKQKFIGVEEVMIKKIPIVGRDALETIVFRIIDASPVGIAMNYLAGVLLSGLTPQSKRFGSSSAVPVNARIEKRL